MRREKVYALIVARASVGEADRRLTLFTRTLGLIRAIAKGVRKIPSRRGGHIEPLTEILALISGSPDHYFVSAVEPRDTFFALHANLPALQYAERMSRTLTTLFHEEEVLPTLYDAFRHALQLLPTLAPPKQRLLAATVTWHALQCAGIVPDLNQCHVCTRRVPRDAVLLDGHAGGWRCLSCHPTLAGTRASITPALLKVLRFMSRYPEQALRLQLSAEQSQQLLLAIQEYTAHTTDSPRASSPLPSHSSYSTRP